ncbi:MAG: methyltransferase domain-containing protein [Acidobacteria bacterium]|nr:methyltransferase domain-containing protein [Acidobacteriota bacterium]
MKAYQPLLEKYGRQASTYDRRWNLRWGHATMRETISAIPWAGADRLLDVGCGTGLLEAAVSSRLGGSTVLVGVDICAPMLQQARQNIPDQKHVALTNAPAEHLPFADQTFNVVICNNSFHYYQHPEMVLAEFRRVLCPSGRLILTDWSSDFPGPRIIYWVLRLAEHAGFGRYSLKHCYTARELNAMLVAAGFQVAAARKVAMDLGWGITVVQARA